MNSNPGPASCSLSVVLASGVIPCNWYTAHCHIQVNNSEESVTKFNLDEVRCVMQIYL